MNTKAIVFLELKKASGSAKEKGTCFFELFGNPVP